MLSCSSSDVKRHIKKGKNNKIPPGTITYTGIKGSIGHWCTCRLPGNVKHTLIYTPSKVKRHLNIFQWQFSCMVFFREQYICKLLLPRPFLRLSNLSECHLILLQKFYGVLYTPTTILGVFLSLTHMICWVRCSSLYILWSRYLSINSWI